MRHSKIVVAISSYLKHTENNHHNITRLNNLMKISIINWNSHYTIGVLVINLNSYCSIIVRLSQQKAMQEVHHNNILYWGWSTFFAATSTVIKLRVQRIPTAALTLPLLLFKLPKAAEDLSASVSNCQLKEASGRCGARK